MTEKMSILEKAGVPDPLKVFDKRGHVNEVNFRDFVLYPDKMEEADRLEVERHLNWCKDCRERQKEKFLPLDEQ